MVPLPAPSTLRALLQRVAIETGISEQVLAAIKKRFAKYEAKDRIVTLMFDEMSTRKHFSYNRMKERIDGYQDHKGQPKSKKVCTRFIKTDKIRM